MSRCLPLWKVDIAGDKIKADFSRPLLPRSMPSGASLNVHHLAHRQRQREGAASKEGESYMYGKKRLVVVVRVIERGLPMKGKGSC